MGLSTSQRYVIILTVSGIGWPHKLATTNDIYSGSTKVDWIDIVNSGWVEPNPYMKAGSEAATVSIPSGFNDMFDFEAISGLNGYETSGYLYSGWQDLGHTKYTTYASVWVNYDHNDITDSGNVGFVCSSLYDWTLEHPSGVWKIRYLDDEARFAI